MTTTVKVLYSLGYVLLIAGIVYVVIYYKNVLQDTGSLLLLAGAAVQLTLYSAVKVCDIWRQEEDND